MRCRSMLVPAGAHGLAVRALCALSLLGCESIAGIKDRFFEAPEPDAGSTDLDAGPKDAATEDAASEDAGKPDAGVDEPDAAPADGGVDAGQDAGPELTPCRDYCDTVLSACTGQYAVYATPGLCNAVCEQFEEGDLSEAEPSGNTLACRLNQARDALDTGEPQAHCAAAGPGGAGVCGENCASYCKLYDTLCEAQPDCLAKCEGLRDEDDEPGRDFNASTFDVMRHHDGDFLQCRLVHVSSASVEPGTHCWHAALIPRPMDTELNPCADTAATPPRCFDYCRLIMTACTEGNAVYESRAQCEQVCTAFEVGLSTDAGGQNTLGCRKAHSYNALAGAPGTHCPHAGPGGNGVCGDNCTSYCREVAAACPTDFAAKFTASEDPQAECIKACADVPVGEAYSVTEGMKGGNTLACRLLHTSQAFGDAAQCTNALGGGVCQ